MSEEEIKLIKEMQENCKSGFDYYTDPKATDKYNALTHLIHQNEKYKEVIDKAIKYIEQHAMTVTDGTVTTNKHELLEILKEVK